MISYVLFFYPSSPVPPFVADSSCTCKLCPPPYPPPHLPPWPALARRSLKNIMLLRHGDSASLSLVVVAPPCRCDPLQRSHCHPCHRCSTAMSIVNSLFTSPTLLPSHTAILTITVRWQQLCMLRMHMRFFLLK